jgi:hypothetical protein
VLLYFGCFISHLDVGSEILKYFNKSTGEGQDPWNVTSDVTRLFLA